MRGKFFKKFKELAEAFKKKGPKAKWFLAYTTIPTTLLLGALALRLADPAALVDVRNWTFDAFQRARPRAYRPESPVRIIDIDDESLEKIGQWPWPRTKVAAVVERLRELGAGVVVFDVVFAEPDRTSPRRIAKNLPDAPGLAGLKSELKKLPDNDRVLAKAIKRASVVTGFSLSDKENPIRPVRRARFGLGSVQKVKLKIKEGQSRIEAIQEAARRMKQGDEADLKSFLPEHYAGAVKNVTILELAAKGNGNFSILRDRDGIIRRVPLLYKLDGEIYPSLAADALRVAQGIRDIKVKASGASGESWRGFIGIASVRIGAFTIPTDQEGRVLLYDTGHKPERYVPVWRLFDESFDASALEGSIAFIGTSAAGLQDIRATPLSPIIPGVEIHAQLAEQILFKEFLERPDYAAAVEICFLVLLGAALILLMPRLGAAWCAMIALGAAAGAFGLSWYEYAAKHYLLDPLYPSLAVLLVYLSSSLIHYLRTESERKQVRGAFSRYMSPALVEQLAKDPSRLRLGGEKRDMTLMFSDIRGFTTISEQFTAEGLTHFINLYLTPMTGIVLKKGGTIDKYMGDCIMAFWNAPLDDPDHVRKACEAALEMTRRLGELNVEWEAEAKKYGSKFIPIRAGVGLNTGECCVGNMGSEQRFDYSVLGDAVNLASRLEGQSKTYGVDIVLGPDTREAAEGFATVELDLIKVKGKTVPVHIYVLLGGSDRGADPKFREFAGKHAEMISAYRAQDWDRAGELMGECRKLEPVLGKLYDLYAGRVKAYRAAPPSENWDGVFTATTK